MFKIFVKKTASSAFLDITSDLTRDSLKIEDNIQEKANVSSFGLEVIGNVREAQEVKIFDTTELITTSTKRLLTVKDLFSEVKKFRVGNDVWLNAGDSAEEKVQIEAINTVSEQISISTASSTYSAGVIIGIKKFGGHLTRVSDKNLRVLENVVYGINATDYTKEFNRRNINDSFQNKTAKEITDEFVKELVNVGLTNIFTTSLMATASVFANVRAAFKSPMELMQEMADKEGNFAWWIDYDRRIHYTAFQNENAPFSLNDNSNNFSKLKITTDLTKVKNRQVVLGGMEDSLNTITEFHKGDDVKREWVLKAKFANMSIAIGTNSTSMTTASVLPDYINAEGSAEYFSNFQMQSIRAGITTSTLTSADLIRFQYNEKVPINVLDEDLGSINALKNLGFGDGVIEGRPIVDKSLEKRSEVQDRARAELLKYSNPILNASFVTEEQGLKAGQVISIQDSVRNIKSDFLIQKVTEEVYAGDKSRFRVVCASTLLGITELIQKLLKASGNVELDDNTKIDLLKLIQERVSMTSSFSRENENIQLETVSMTTSVLVENQTPPFLWGQDPDLLGWWKFDEESGIIAKDKSNHERNADIDASHVTLDGEWFTFDNVDVENKVRLPASSDLFESGDLSFSTVIYPTNISTQQYIFDHYNWRFRFSNNKIVFTVGRMTDAVGPTFDAVSLNDLSNNQEYSLVGLYHPDPGGGNGYIKLYINGVHQETVDIGNLEIWVDYGNKDLQWGNSNHGSAIPYEGKIKQSRILERILTEEEITAISNNQFFNTNAPQGKWDLSSWS